MKRGMDRLTEQAQHAGATPTGEGASSTDSCETGIFLSGIQQFIEIFDMRNTTDPFAVAGRLMYEIGFYGAINRVFVADRAVDRNEHYKDRAVIIYFNSTFQKSDKNMTRTRVVNKSGSAVLQHREGASKRFCSYKGRLETILSGKRRRSKGQTDRQEGAKQK